MSEDQRLADITVGQVVGCLAPVIWLFIGAMIISFLIDHPGLLTLVVALILHLFGVKGM